MLRYVVRIFRYLLLTFVTSLISDGGFQKIFPIQRLLGTNKIQKSSISVTLSTTTRYFLLDCG